ncbi:hypothetical protein ASE95_10795 [Sphingomonas sp. Leaf231]|uniref:hypothetical protein n=1 Tax=Sphingomonas sp. Leaf231 TaxID=1736301 RepID=UPI0006F2752C|nr:hypothetical protein [Sphingomonas sp. Leaf231]KQN93061.1 hypothetical protein ASE95_10795 [Sphingomonas sp. Leaf231]
MTDTLRPSEILRIGIIDNHQALAAARADLELYKRLMASEALLAQLEATEAQYTRDLEKVVAKEAAEDKRKRKAAIRNLAITTTMPDRASGVLSATFTISWEQPSYDHETRESRWTAKRAVGFTSLSEDIYAYLMEFRREAIPSLIMDLAPEDPELAMHRYFVSRSRGFVSI